MSTAGATPAADPRQQASPSSAPGVSTGSAIGPPATPSVGAIPTITLPKGGGAISGMGEKFDVNPVNGTAAFTIPIGASPARGLEPNLSLTYNSGSGNGPFGLGWGLAIPSITRKTEKGLPRYLDSIESDVFCLAGVEDLVPRFEKNRDGHVMMDDNGRPVYQEQHHGEYSIRRHLVPGQIRR
jgi:hypothetical protein